MRRQQTVGINTESSHMLKKELIKEVALHSGQTEKLTREMLGSVLSVVLTKLSHGTSVMLLGLGKLSVRRRGERVARNIHTGAKVMVAPRNVVVLSASDAVHDAINVSQS